MGRPELGCLCSHPGSSLSGGAHSWCRMQVTRGWLALHPTPQLSVQLLQMGVSVLWKPAVYNVSELWGGWGWRKLTRLCLLSSLSTVPIEILWRDLGCLALQLSGLDYHGDTASLSCCHLMAEVSECPWSRPMSQALRIRIFFSLMESFKIAWEIEPMFNKLYFFKKNFRFTETLSC